jgi:hypothetical protein
MATLLRMAPLRGAVCIAVALLAGACTQTFERRDANHEPVAVERAGFALVDTERLDVRIRSFEPAPPPPENSVASTLSEEVRRAEGHFAAVQLKRAMEESGYWGDVRIVPGVHPGDEVRVSGQVLESDGEILGLEVTVEDATGRRWFTNRYEGVVTESVYRSAGYRDKEPFAFLYARIANEIGAYRAGMSAREVSNLRQVAELRFAYDFAPYAFKEYLKTGTGPLFGRGGVTYEAVRSPPDDDPMTLRLRKVRGREREIVETLDGQYEDLASRIRVPYTEWRDATLRKMNIIRDFEEGQEAKLTRSAATAAVGILAGVLVGRTCDHCAPVGVAVGATVAGPSIQELVKAGAGLVEDGQIVAARDELDDLAASLKEKVEPVVMEIEGETVRLQGSSKEKFDQWRDAIRRIYLLESGQTGAAR